MAGHVAGGHQHAAVDGDVRPRHLRPELLGRLRLHHPVLRGGQQGAGERLNILNLYTLCQCVMSPIRVSVIQQNSAFSALLYELLS